MSAAPHPPAGSVRQRAVQSAADGARWLPLRLLAGTALAVAVLLLGLLARSGPLARMDLRVDEHIAAHDRTAWLTSAAKLLSTVATPETVGVGLMLVIPALLLVARRRTLAVLVFCVFGAAAVFGEAAKMLVGEHRPPTSLQLVPADSASSYPSGHATVAAVIAIVAVLVATGTAWRWVAIVLGSLFALAVAASRVYLGDHYPLDVIGGIGCAFAAALVVYGVAELLVGRRGVTTPTCPAAP